MIYECRLCSDENPCLYDNGITNSKTHLIPLCCPVTHRLGEWVPVEVGA
jgi:hypothetical protein